MFSQHLFRLTSIAVLILALPLVNACASYSKEQSLEKVQQNIREWKRKQGDTNKQAFLAQAYEHMNNGEYDEAIEQCEYLRELRPGDNDVYMLESLSYRMKGNFSVAIDLLSRVISSEPNRGDAYFFRGLNYQSLGYFEKASQDIDTAIGNPHSAAQLAKFRNDQQHTEPGAGGLEKDGARAMMYHQKADTYSRLGRLDVALASISTAIALVPGGSSELLLKRGDIYRAQGQLALAYADFSSAQELDPQRFEGWNNMGTINLQLGKYSEAIVQFGRAWELDPLNSTVGTNLSLAYWLVNDKVKSLKTASKVFRAKPNFSTYYHAAYFHHENGNQEKALEYFKKSQELEPEILSVRESIVRRCPSASPTRKFYEEEFTIAKQYLTSGKTLRASAQAQQKPLLTISKLLLEPNPALVNKPFDIHLNFTLNFPASSENILPSTVHFQISRDNKVLFKSDSYAVEANNRQLTDWKLHMNPVPKAGDYTLEILVQYKNLEARKGMTMTIR